MSIIRNNKSWRITDIWFFSVIYLLLILLGVSIIFKIKIDSIYFQLGIIILLFPVVIAKVFFSKSRFTNWLEKYRF